MLPVASLMGVTGGGVPGMGGQQSSATSRADATSGGEIYAGADAAGGRGFTNNFAAAGAEINAPVGLPAMGGLSWIFIAAIAVAGLIALKRL